jgi:ABC-type polysaccharide/polyol phosphate transport system ATPase subunit
MTAVPAIEVTNITKAFLIPHEQRTWLKEYIAHPFQRRTFERNEALNHVTFDVAPGEFFGVIGRNGSGKSTLLKVLAGIYPADSGTVRTRGRLSPFIELGVGFNGDLSARENIWINGTLLGLTRPQIESRFDEIVAWAELERFVDLKLKNYSSGMALRLAYSIAIQVPWEILLLDEVLAVGDRTFLGKCFATFDRFKAEGRTIVYVSHDLASVERWCNRALYLEDGHVAAIGLPAEVIAAYRSQTGDATSEYEEAHEAEIASLG